MRGRAVAKKDSAPQPRSAFVPTPPSEESQLAAVAVARVGKGGYAKFGDIPAHRLGRALRDRLYRLANSLAEDERGNLCQRLKHAATTVTASLATGFGEGTFRSGVTRALESRGALLGIQDHIDQLGDQHLLDEKMLLELKSEVDLVLGALNEYLGVLVKSRDGEEGRGQRA